MARLKKDKGMRRAINQNITRIYEMKYEVLKMAGDFHSTAKWHKGMPGGCFHGNTETYSK